MLDLRQLRPRAAKLVGPALAALLILSALPAISPAPASAQSEVPSLPPGAAYRQSNLVSDLPGVALVEDGLLVNPWGISMTASSPFWVANNGSGTSTLYRGHVGSQPLVKNTGTQAVTIPGGQPTGTVANTTNDFVITSQCVNPPCPGGPARFLFATLTGRIAAWHPSVPAPNSTTATVVAVAPGRVYTGLAIGNNGSENFLYAADFAGNRIDVYNRFFTAVSPSGNFVDPTIPAGFHPFNIQALGGKLYVAYAKRSPFTGLDEPGSGNGFISTFDFNGNFTGRLVSGGHLMSPWGMAIAPADFGVFSGKLIVGNHSTGGVAPSINAYDPVTGAHAGAMLRESGGPVVIEGLWGLTFGNGGSGGDPKRLYFAAGIDRQFHGLFGSLEATTATATSLIQFSSDNYLVSEGGGHIDITVTRSGDVSGSATVDYATFDDVATQKSDYQIALGTLRFGPGETSKTFRVLVVDDNAIAGGSSFVLNLWLSNPTGAGLGTIDKARLAIMDNEFDTPKEGNPIDEAEFFVRQHYLDFLNREPDAPGLAFWTNQITECESRPEPQRQGCREIRRINVSAAFFQSIEFQQTGFLVHLTHRTAFAARPTYGQFMRDAQAISRGVVIGQPNARELLEQNTRAFFDNFVTRPEFRARYDALSNDDYVLALLQNAGVNTTTGRLSIARLEGSQVVPPRTTPATGIGVVRQSLSGNTVTVSLSFSNLTSPETEAHIHGPARAGANAGPLFTLPLGEFNNFRLTLTNQQFLQLADGQFYFDVHTQNFPDGEIRGQIPFVRFVRDVLLTRLDDGTITRAQALRLVAESDELAVVERNPAFVELQYFGYLRRNPDAVGFQFWLDKLNSFGGDFIRAEMVKAFITSSEYRNRFATF